MADYSEEEKREIDRQLRNMKQHVLGAIGGNGIHLFPGLEERSQEINIALNNAAGLIGKLRDEIGYQEPGVQLAAQAILPPPTSVTQTGAQRLIAPLRVMLTLKSNISADDRAHVWKHLTTPPSPGLDPMGIPANQAFKYALRYERDDDAKAILDELEALPGVESANIIPSSF